MVALDDRVLRVAHCRETLSVRELVRLIEQSHATDAAGVSQDLLTEYADALAEIELTLESQTEPGVDPERFAFTRGIFERELRAHATDESAWVNETALYALTDERISIYPPEWHEALSGTTDLADCFAFVDDTTPFQGTDQESTTGSGVTERALLGVATVIGALDPAAANSQLTAAKEQGKIVEVSDRASNPTLQLRTAADTGDQALPPLVDIRDALDAIETSAHTDVSGDVDRIRDALRAFGDREQAAKDSLIADIERQINALREQLSGDADRRAEGVQHRLQQYRDSPADSAPTLSGAALRDETGTQITIPRYSDESAVLSGTLVNGGDAREVTTMLTFYTDNGTPLRTIEGPPIEIGPGEHHSVELPVAIPPEATAYATSVLDVDDPRTVGERPEP
jgi:hypothetical protein